jgi:hypothetical protein
MAFGGIIAIKEDIEKSENEKKLQKEIKNAPKYKIQGEAFENQAIAKSQAFGRDRDIQMQQENISQEASNAASEASKVSNSTTSLLSTIAAINANKNQNLRGLSQDEAGMRKGKMQDLYGANNAMIDEKDKAWNYNINMPYQMKIAALRDRIQANAEMSMAGVNYEASTSSAMMGSMGGMMGG